MRPFGTIDLFDGRLTVQTGRKKDVSRQILANPRVELCAFDGERWLRLATAAVEDPRIEAQVHMLEAYPSLQGMYQPGDGQHVDLRTDGGYGYLLLLYRGTPDRNLLKYLENARERRKPSSGVFCLMMLFWVRKTGVGRRRVPPWTPAR